MATFCPIVIAIQWHLFNDEMHSGRTNQFYFYEMRCCYCYGQLASLCVESLTEQNKFNLILQITLSMVKI